MGSGYEFLLDTARLSWYKVLRDSEVRKHVSVSLAACMADALVENKVVVKIFGEDYPVMGTDDPAYISRVADYVDSRMKEVAQRARSGARDKVAILTALSIAAELIDRADGLNTTEKEYYSRLDKLTARLDDALSDRLPSAG